MQCCYILSPTTRKEGSPTIPWPDCTVQELQSQNSECKKLESHPRLERKFRVAFFLQEIKRRDKKKKELQHFTSCSCDFLIPPAKFFFFACTFFLLGGLLSLSTQSAELQVQLPIKPSKHKYASIHVLMLHTAIPCPICSSYIDTSKREQHRRRRRRLSSLCLHTTRRARDHESRSVHPAAHWSTLPPLYFPIYNFLLSQLLVPSSLQLTSPSPSPSPVRSLITLASFYLQFPSESTSSILSLHLASPLRSPRVSV